MPETNQKPKIRNRYDPKGRQRDRLKRVYDRYLEMKDNPDRVEMAARWDKAQKNWEAWRPEKKGGEWNSNHVPPLTTATIESALAEMSDQNTRPLILPRSADDKPRSTVMKHIFDFTWDVADGDYELFKVEKNLLIFGTALAQEYYWQDKRIVRKLVNPNAKSRKDKYEETEVMEYDDCYMENVSPYDIFIDENARSINRGPYKARDIIRRYVMPLSTFEQFFKGEVWDMYDNAKYVEGMSGDVNYYEFFKPPTGEKMDKKVEVLWYWSRNPDDSLIIVANDVLLVDKPNIYRHKQLPFAEAIDIPRPNQFYGKGEADVMESIQDEYTLLRRMILDRNHLDIDKMFLVSSRLTLDDRDLIARPHGVIEVDDIDGIKPMEYGDIPRSVQLSLEMLKQDAVRVTGIEDQSQAVRTPQTATEAAILKEAVLKRVRTKLKLLSKGFLTDIGRMRVANIIQFYSQPKLEKILGDRDSEKYKAILEREQLKGTLIKQGRNNFRAKFRDIRVKNKELISDETGGIVERPFKGVSFFEAKPESFIPVSTGGYDVKFEAGADMPVSKPLMQSKVLEMFDRLMPLAQAGIYDPMKLGDKLLEVHDFDPEDFKVEQETKKIETARDEMSMEMAARENEMLMTGQPIPELGTPYASAGHTEIHLAFMKSDRFKQVGNNDPRFKMMSQHVIGETAAILQRGGSLGEMMMGQQAQAKEAASALPSTAGMEGAIPGRIQGGGDVPTMETMRKTTPQSRGKVI